MSEEKEYDLKTSIEKLGVLIPIIEDAHGNIIDGLHRDKLVPDCKRIRLEHITTPVQLEMARAAINECRRVVGAEERAERYGKIIELTEWKPKELADNLGIPYRTIMRYLPDEHKEKPETTERLTQKTQLATVASRHEHVNYVECDRCHMGTGEATSYRNETLCPRCLESAKHKPVRSAVEIKPRVTTTTYKVKERWEDRAAKMHPQVSKMEQTILIKLAEKGLHPETQKEFCLQSTRPDYYFHRKNIGVYLDGPVHKGREDRDETLRELLRRRHGVQVVSIMYEGDSEATENQIVQDILEATK